MAHVVAWKSHNIDFETTRSYGVNLRFQQYLDIIMQDLGLNPYRKMPNIFYEMFARYGPLDYATVVEEYFHNKKYRSRPLKPVQANT